jgi:hypothetical protein
VVVFPRGRCAPTPARHLCRRPMEAGPEAGSDPAREQAPLLRTLVGVDGHFSTAARAPVERVGIDEAPVH